uniref:G_PROTEIN_RECEP_F1_2 domain-containing protein n=2 Tax=Caenorhabditis tropicalis TaxID=1561998 RepID=A0A1I7V2F4_9PELO
MDNTTEPVDDDYTDYSYVDSGSHYQFQKVNDPLTCFFVNLLYNSALFLGKIRFIPAFFGLIVNVFHLIILTRKLMRTSCINVIMIGISIADLRNLSYVLYRKWIMEREYDKCDLPDSTNYTFLMIEHWAQMTNEVTRRVSAMLGVMIALVRTLVLKYPFNSRFESLHTPGFGIKSIVFISILSSMINILYWGPSILVDGNANWFPPEECGYPKDFSAPRYQYETMEIFRIDSLVPMQMFQAAGGISKMIPAVALPILTGMLVKDIRASQKSRATLVSQRTDKSDQTTKMITLMTVTSMISEGPLGVLEFMLMFTPGSMRLLVVISDFMSIFEVIVVFNTMTHCFACLVMSSQYRNTAKETFGCRNSKSTTIQGIPSSNSFRMTMT